MGIPAPYYMYHTRHSPPRAKDILERRVLICAARVRALHYPVRAAVVPPLKRHFSVSPPILGHPRGSRDKRKGQAPAKGKGKGCLVRPGER